MKTNLFETFAKMVESLPVNGILTVAELQEEIIEDDLLRKQILPTEEAVSIVNFCRFVQAVAQGSGIFPTILPTQHLAFYQKTMKRLIEAGELPFHANELFNKTFLSVFSENHWLYKLGNGGMERKTEGARATRIAA